MLMGGEPRKQWYLDPEKPFIVVGTQDMLLSRALNRGYGMGYNMWPVEYGLVNNDCLWVLDEIQLMANGLPTSTQLHGLRSKLKTFGPAQSMWMSAIAHPAWLATIDHPRPSAWQVMKLGSEDLMDARLGKRRNAHKVLMEALGNIKNSKAMAAFVVEQARARDTDASHSQHRRTSTEDIQGSGETPVTTCCLTRGSFCCIHASARTI